MDRFDVFIVGGGGTGSEVAGLLGNRGGMRIGFAERERLGGECNWYGCVPSKTMLRTAKLLAWARRADRFGVRIPEWSLDFDAVIERVRGIVEHNTAAGARPFTDMGIAFFPEEARLLGERRLELASGATIEADRIVLATGTEATAPPIPGLDGAPYWTNKEAIWSAKRVPASLAILGSGPIGIEFAQIYARFGAAVTIVEILPRILPPEDADSAAALLPALDEDGITVLTGVRTTRIEHGPRGWTLHIEGRAPLEVEELLVATGRRPCFDVHDLDAAGVQLDGRGNPVLDETLRSTAPGIWIAGDATGELLFVHVNDYEARVVADDIGGARTPRDYRVVPKVTYCEPEVASVGLTEEQARAEGSDVVIAIDRFEESERARIEGATFGQVKLVADARTRELLGGHIVGESAGELIHEVVLAMAASMQARTVADAIHSYPTLSQTVRGAFWQLAEKLGE